MGTPLEIRALYDLENTNQMVMMTIGASSPELPVECTLGSLTNQNAFDQAHGISVSTVNTNKLEQVFDGYKEGLLDQQRKEDAFKDKDYQQLMTQLPGRVSRTRTKRNSTSLT